MEPESLMGIDIVTTSFDFSGNETTNIGQVKLIIFDDSWCHQCSAPIGSSIPRDFDGQKVALIQVRYNEKCFHCGYSTLAKMANDTGADAILIYSLQNAGHDARVFNNRHTWKEMSDINYPAFEIGELDVNMIRPLLRSKIDVYLDLQPSYNPWLSYFDSTWIVMQVVCLFFIIPATLFSARRLYQITVPLAMPESRKVAAIVIGIEFGCNVVRLVYVAVDPLWSHGVFQYGIGRILLSVTIGFELFTDIILSIEWINIRSLFKNCKPCSRGCRWVMIIFGICMILFDMISSLLTSACGFLDLALASAFVTAACNFCIAMVFLYTGEKMVQEMKSKSVSYFDEYKPEDAQVDIEACDSPTKGDQPIVERKCSSIDAEIHRMMNIIKTNAVVMILLTIPVALFGVLPVLFDRIGRAIIFTLTFMLLSITSVLKIKFFKVRK